MGGGRCWSFLIFKTVDEEGMVYLPSTIDLRRPIKQHYLHQNSSKTEHVPSNTSLLQCQVGALGDISSLEVGGTSVTIYHPAQCFLV